MDRRRSGRDSETLTFLAFTRKPQNLRWIISIKVRLFKHYLKAETVKTDFQLLFSGLYEDLPLA